MSFVAIIKDGEDGKVNARLTNAKVGLLLPMIWLTVQSRELLVSHDLAFHVIFVNLYGPCNMWQECLTLLHFVR